MAFAWFTKELLVGVHELEVPRLLWDANGNQGAQWITLLMEIGGAAVRTSYLYMHARYNSAPDVDRDINASI